MAPAPIPKIKNIIVFGAGITGLQTALSLLCNPITSHYTITIIASHFPGDLSPQYTSPWAGGHWRSHVSSDMKDDEVRKFDERTYKYWRELLMSPSQTHGSENKPESVEHREKRIGLGLRMSRNFWGKQNFETVNGDGSGIWWRNLVDGFEVLRAGDLKEGAVFGIGYQSVCINIPRYLEYIFEQVKSLGARIVKAEVDPSRGLEGVVGRYREISSGMPGDSVFAVVNCAGLSARHFISPLEAAKIYPIRGQTVLVRGEVARTQTYTSVPESPDTELLYVVPRPGSGTTILGGCKEVGSWEEGVDEELNERIMSNVRKFGLIGDGEFTCTGKIEGNQGFEILGVQVGFRPGREGGPRVERGERMEGGCWIVHAYGHAGGGYQSSVGSAEKVVNIIVGLSD